MSEVTVETVHDSSSYLPRPVHDSITRRWSTYRQPFAPRQASSMADPVHERMLRKQTPHEPPSPEHERRDHSSKRFKSEHAPIPSSGLHRTRFSQSPERERRSRSPMALERSSSALHSTRDSAGSRSSPLIRSSRISDAARVPNSGASELHGGYGRGPPASYFAGNADGQAAPAMPVRTSAADAFRSVRAEGRERDAGGAGMTQAQADAGPGPGPSSETRSRPPPPGGPFGPMSPGESSSSFGRPRVGSTASERDQRRMEYDRGGGDRGGPTLPSIRAPRSPAFGGSGHHSSPAVGGLGFHSRGPLSGPSHLEGPSLPTILPPPPGFGPPGKGQHPALPHRRSDFDPGRSTAEPGGPPSTNEHSMIPTLNDGRPHLPPISHLAQHERGPPPGHSPSTFPPARSDRFHPAGPEPAHMMPHPPPPGGPGPGGAGPHEQQHQQQQQHFQAPAPPPSHHAQPGPSGNGPPYEMGGPPHSQAMPFAYAPGSEGGPAPGPPLSQAAAVAGPSTGGVPGSLSSLGAQAAADRRSAKQQPSFVNKLYSMLEDERIAHMISWAPSGTVFSVANPSVFSKVVLPQWFKHSNWQSFVRQLNMYGFNKVNQTFQGDPIDEIQVWEFRHPRFRRGEVHLLNEIKRKNSRHKRAMSPTMSNSGGDYESRRDASPTPSPEMSSISMDEQARQMNDPRMRAGGDEFAYMASGPPSWQGPSPAHTGMPFPHDGPSGMHAPPPPSLGPTGMPAMHSHPERRESDSSFNLNLRDHNHRLNDMSDRIDAIIRHSNYLESQLRSVSERLQQSQQAEQAIATHVSRTLNTLISLASSGSPAGSGPGGPPSSTAEERDVSGRAGSLNGGLSAEARHSMLAACRAEVEYLQPYVNFSSPWNG